MNTHAAFPLCVSCGASVATSRRPSSNPLFLRLSSVVWISATVSWSTCPSFISSVSSQSKTPQQGSSSTWDVGPHHWRAHQSPLALRAAANEIQGGDADVPCTARLCTIMILGDVIHMCHRHAALTQAQVRLHWTAWRSNLPSVNSRRSCFSCCWYKGLERPAKRCDIIFVAGGVQEQIQDVLVRLLLRNCSTPNDTIFSQ